MDEHPSNFTLAGRILILVCLVVGLGGPFLNFYFVFERLPAGRYPLVMFATPFILAAFLLYFLIAAILRKYGIAVHKSELESYEDNEE